MATRSQDVNKKQTAVSSCEKVQETLNLVNTKGVLRGADSLSPTFQTVQRHKPVTRGRTGSQTTRTIGKWKPAGSHARGDKEVSIHLL